MTIGMRAPPSHIPNANPVRMRQRSTGETALVRPGARKGVSWAQFDRLTHKHAAGWWAYSSSDFEVINEPSDPE